MKRIRVLHITQSAGGVLRYIQMLLKYMDKDRFENIIICSYESKREDYGDFIAGFEQVDMNREISFSDLNAVIKVRNFIKKYKPDIVYAHSSKGGAIGRIANIGLKNRCVYNPHGWSFNMHCSNRKQRIYTIIERMLASFCDKIICISDAERQSAIERKICQEKKFQVILNGIDIEGYEKSRHNQFTKKSLHIPENAYVIGMAGRICPQKAPDIFIRMAKKVKGTIPEAFFMIVGDGKMKGEIVKYADENGLSDSLYITGWADNAMRYIELFDIAVLLSRWEGFGLVLPEYMLAQKPVVATRVDAIPSIIQDRKNGLLVESENIDQIYEAIIKIYESRILAGNMVSNGLKDVYTRFDVKRVVREHTQLFQELTGKYY